MASANYKKRNVIAAMLLLFCVVMADHFSSPTFAYNMGKGGDTILLKLDEISASGCGAP